MTEKTIIQTTNAPQAIGTYSQAVNSHGTLYVSGQIPLDPKTMNMVSDDFAAQCHKVFKNLKAVVNAAGGELSDIVQLTIYLTDLSCFSTLNEVMASYFAEPYPARAAVEVAALPKAAKVEIQGIADLGTHG